ncbi:uncharacterized protein LOC143147590 [Ptiloglossa arizonensis]|uniref:uncharacterized protein LOC143147590 n=1 Tax=Ptiloglossa arizonensis TaxID=3350558 RepID=UPI003FA0B37B
MIRQNQTDASSIEASKQLGLERRSTAADGIKRHAKARSYSEFNYRLARCRPLSSQRNRSSGRARLEATLDCHSAVCAVPGQTHYIPRLGFSLQDALMDAHTTTETVEGTSRGFRLGGSGLDYHRATTNLIIFIRLDRVGYYLI